MLDKLRASGKRPAAFQSTHQDEFPTVYSSAGCSPAEPAYASTAATIFNHNRPFTNGFLVNGNCPRITLSQFSTQSRTLSPTCIASCYLELARSGILN